MGIDLELLHKIKGVIECPVPDKDIRRFDANFRLFPPFIDNDLCPLTIKNTILQSCYLRNTEWACGVAVYTGKQWYVQYPEEGPWYELLVIPLRFEVLLCSIMIPISIKNTNAVVQTFSEREWKELSSKKTQEK
ncbi:P-type ATPase, subfamily IV [Trema orientale]|uniref:P-type ATPase, subfamily IV n=1 Tax=Trema orientale TaxID=63057 RepID=A0A2P5EWT3_TREOI|nr:P-type ATPase, subfamily IV [Trema orientale]